MTEKPETLGDGPIEPAFQAQMNGLATALDQIFNGALRGQDRKVGFCLMVFNFDDAGRANYISNAHRADVITMLKEQLARFEGQPEMKGNA
jgi:hypothetical protein